MSVAFVDPVDALKAFEGRGITVQTTRPIEVPAKTITGKTARGPGFQTIDEPLAAAHILSAKRREDGRIVITTIDGRKHESVGRQEVAGGVEAAN